MLLIRQPHKAQRCTAWFGLQHEVGMTHAMVHALARCALHVACRTLHVARCTCSATDRATALYGSDGFSEQMRFTCVRQHSEYSYSTNKQYRTRSASVGPGAPFCAIGCFARQLRSTAAAAQSLPCHILYSCTASTVA